MPDHKFIKNYSKLSVNRNRKLLLDILEIGLYAAMPSSAIRNTIKDNKIICRGIIDLLKYNNIYTVAVGKAADSMTATIDEIVKIKSGVIVIPQYTKSVTHNKKFRIFASGHPLPNKISTKAANYIVKFLQKINKNEFVIFLISGGGSALLASPDTITLNDKIKTTKILLESGVPIYDINIIRKHISKIKGGKLLNHINADWASLIISDVVNNRIDTISSGYTYYDDNNSKAWEIIQKYDLIHKLPIGVVSKIHEDIFKIQKTKIQKNDRNYIILNNDNCLTAMASYVCSLGIDTKIINGINGDVDYVASRLTKLISNKNRSCIVFGGETTVNIGNSNGVGGRNQELILRILKKCKNKNYDLIISSINTDGIDGNTMYAGAISENKSIDYDRIDVYINNHNSNLFFKERGDLINTGSTHTNLADIGVILRL